MKTIKVIKSKLYALKKLRGKVPGYSMSELLIVLCIIGILILLVLPNQTSVITQAKAIEAQSMLNHVYGLEKSHFYRYSKYTTDFEALGFEHAKTISDGGQAVYKIEIIEASPSGFKARATAISDFDGDGSLNTWEIDQNKILLEVIKD